MAPTRRLAASVAIAVPLVVAVLVWMGWFPALSSSPSPPPQDTSAPVAALEEAGTAERLVGDRAAEYIAQSRLRYLHTGAHLRWAGAKPTQQVVVLRTQDHRPAGWHAEPSQSQYSFAASAVTSQGAVTFWSWDDGNSATWEGVILVESYSGGSWSSWEAQIDISTSAYSTVWAEWTGGEIEEEYQTDLLADPELRLAAWGHGGCGGPSGCPGYGAEEMQDFVTCIVSGCSGVAATCRLLGPGWAHCFAGGCAGIIVQCALDSIL